MLKHLAYCRFIYRRSGQNWCIVAPQGCTYGNGSTDEKSLISGITHIYYPLIAVLTHKADCVANVRRKCMLEKVEIGTGVAVVAGNRPLAPYPWYGAVDTSGGAIPKENRHLFLVHYLATISDVIQIQNHPEEYPAPVTVLHGQCGIRFGLDVAGADVGGPGGVRPQAQPGGQHE
ncbi:hypothetical protein [Hymenobacter sp.]|uniref:hypothetical protein n=1 Tax=Hymenobacter sp. TaxID=1898978 RepID=UPI00286A12DE|nr:hypothetical protein [Hymenobacter sp.]